MMTKDKCIDDFIDKCWRGTSGEVELKDKSFDVWLRLGVAL